MNSDEQAALSLFKERVSTRAFSGAPVCGETIRAILEAGTLAPSAANRQPWRFVVVRSRRVLDEISNILMDSLREETLETEHELTAEMLASVRGSARAFEGAGCAVFVFIANPQLWSFVDIQGIGACIQNMTLAATQLGVASLWDCDVLYAERQITNLLGVDRLCMAAALLLGAPTVTRQHKKATRLPLKDVVVKWVEN